MSKAPSKKQDEVNKIEQKYKALFQSDLGRQVLEDMKKSLGYGQTVYREKSSNEDLSFHLGRQSVINGLVNLINKPE